MKTRAARLAIVGAVVAASVTLIAVAPPRLEFTYTRLQNGLRVVISEDHSAPVFAISVTYDVGSRNERMGRTGFAHLFEHMMFKGSQNVGSGEHFVLVLNTGGDMNGTTNKDRTEYFERLPSNQLDLALFLEADRMRSLDITPQNLDNQRQAVQEERRLRVDNSPYGRTDEVISELAYQNFAYAHSTIGSMEDLNAATIDDVQAFFETYYAPNNAVLAIVGDVKTRDALAKVRKYFAAIPSQPLPPRVDMTEPQQTEERRALIQDVLARLTRLDMVYHMPQALTPDADALSVLASVLSEGRSSRLYEAIVRQKQLALNVGASTTNARGPGLFALGGILVPGKSFEDLRAAIDQEIERVKTGPIEPWELDKARNGAKRAVVNSLTSTLQRARSMAQYALFYDSPGLINSRYERVETITAADLQRVAKQYLVKTNRTVVVTAPKAEVETAGTGVAP